MRRRDVKVGMKVVPFKKSLTYDVGIIQAKNAKKNLENSALWKDAEKSGKLFLYVKQFDSEDGFDFVHLGTRRGKSGGADFFLPSDFKPYNPEKKS